MYGNGTSKKKNVFMFRDHAFEWSQNKSLHFVRRFPYLILAYMLDLIWGIYFWSIYISIYTYVIYMLQKYIVKFCLISYELV